ncbi:LuxR C-terminal-related transcriptional regulator [Streptomyces filamentosus]|uniref:LuxR C-terminal-related transcriptional regulator n=1 Tax=Streptomyces filamentosus TaxID=67294 RepID=UPI0037D6503F
MQSAHGQVGVNMDELIITPEDQDTYRLIANGDPVPNGRDVSRLLAAGLVETDRTVREPGRYVALDPYTAVQQAVGTQQVALQQAIHTLQVALRSVGQIPVLESLSAQYRHQPLYVDGSEVVPFGQLMNARIGQAMAGATSEVYAAQPGRPVDRDPDVQRVGQERVLATLARGVLYRGLFQVAALAHEPTAAYVAKVLKAGGDVRIYDGEFPRMVVIDGQHLFIDNRLTPDAERNSGGYVHDRLVVHWARYLFDLYWREATPWRVASGEEGQTVTSSIQRAILRSLAEGVTVQQVGPRVGLKERAVQKHLATLRGKLGFETRDQLMVWWARSEEYEMP